MNVKKPNYTIDLHCHTNRSDGADTPKELVDQAAEAGIDRKSTRLNSSH